MKRIAAAIIVFSILVLATACNSGTEGPVAIVNGVEIARADYNDELEYELSSYEQQGYDLTDEDRETVKEMVLDRLINNLLLLDAAEKAGITRETVDVDGELVKIKESFEGDEKFEEALGESGFTLEEYKDLVADILIIEDLFEQELQISALEVSDAELQDAVDDFLEVAGDEAEDLDIEDVEEYLAYTLREEKANALKGAYIEELRKNSEIEYFEL